MGGNKVLFGNVYSTTNDLPSASTYHGMFAHVHGTGKGYFAHNGSWVPLANASDIVTYTVQDGQLSQNNFTNADHTKLDGIATSANNYTHPNHSGEVTSTADGATVIADNVVDEANLKVSNTPTDGYVLTAQSGNTGGLTWAAAASGGGGGSPDLYADNYTSGTKPVASSSTNGVAIGRDAIATNTNSLALGYTSEATGSAGFAGAGGHATGNNSIAVGNNATASSTYASAYGNSSEASSLGSTAFGYDSHAQTNNYATALGYKASASGTESIGIATSNNTTTYGAKGANGITIGKQAVTATTSDGISIGQLSNSGNKSIALGYGTTSTGSQSVAIGNGSSTGVHFGSTAIGNGVTASTSNEVSIGSSSQDVRISETYTLPKVDGTASGQVLTTDGSGAVSWATPSGGGGSSFTLIKENYTNGTAPTVTGNDSVAIGDNASATGTDSYSFGHYATNAGNTSIAVGGIATVSANANESQALGANSKVTPASGTITNATAIGKSRASTINGFSANIDDNTTSYGAISPYGIAIGYRAKAGSSDRSIAIGSNTEADYRAVAIGYNAGGSGSYGISLGANSSVGIYGSSAAIGYNVQSTDSNQVSIGGSTQNVRISETYTLPKVDGTNGQVLTTDGSGAVTFATPASGGGGADLYAANESSPTAQPSATGTNAIAIGDSAISSNTNSFATPKSRAAGTNSVAMNVNNNTTSYGAQHPFSVSIGQYSRAGNSGISIGSAFSRADGSQSIAIGRNVHANHQSSVALGNGAISDVQGKFVYAGNKNASNGDSQFGLCTLRCSTTDATETIMRTASATSTVVATNQMTLPNNSAHTFSGTIVAREKASEGTDVGAWEVKGIIRREANAGTTVLVNSVINELNVPTGWAIALTADTTLGCLKLAVTGVASTNIRWVATINTSEVTYA